MKDNESDLETTWESRRSKQVPGRIAGWVFVAGYLLLASIAFHEAKTCTVMLCSLAALPAVFPFGFPFYWLIDSAYIAYPTSTGLPGDHLRSWYFIVPTVAANTLFYYWAGRMLAKLARWAGSVFKAH